MGEVVWRPREQGLFVCLSVCLSVCLTVLMQEVAQAAEPGWSVWPSEGHCLCS